MPENEQDPVKKPANNCPFYGRHMYTTPGTGSFLLIAQGGNECAAIRTSLSPCVMEMKGVEIDWRACPVLQFEVHVRMRESQ